jgi:hypothetical protein
MSILPLERELYTPPLAGATAIVPLYYFFAKKSAEQLGLPLPSKNPRFLLSQGLKLAPTAGVVVGLQVVLEGRIKKLCFNNRQDLLATAGSAAIVGGLSLGPLAILNGQSMGRSPLQSIYNLSLKQGSACVARETCFLTGLISSDMLAKYAKGHFGESRTIEYGSAFFGGAMGSAIGHPFDTMFTLWQRNLRVTTLLGLCAGGLTKALACGWFSVGYKTVKDILLDPTYYN